MAKSFHKTLFSEERRFAELTGFTCKEFQILHKRFKDDLMKISLDDPTEEKKGNGRNRLLNTESQLLLFLLWLRQYPVERFLSWIFNILPKQVYQYNRVTLIVFYNYYSQRLGWPNYQYRQRHGVHFRGVFVTVIGDGTEQQILISGNKYIEKNTYSGKKGKHTFTIFIACSPDGYIYFISFSYSGSKPDLSVLNYQENQIYTRLEPNEWIMLDKGYKDLKFARKVVPIVGKSEILLEEEEIYNNDVASIRIVIENVNCEIKKFKICQFTFRAHITKLEEVRIEHNRVWVVVAGIVNEFKAPLRK